METTNSKSKIVTINAADRPLGRVATEVALALRGKTDPHFERHLLSGVEVRVENVAKLKFSSVKLRDKKYANYSGYPGGLRFTSLAQLIAKKGYAEPLRLAVYGMLPANKLRARMMTKLKISE